MTRETRLNIELVVSIFYLNLKLINSSDTHLFLSDLLLLYIVACCSDLFALLNDVHILFCFFNKKNNVPKHQLNILINVNN